MSPRERCQFAVTSLAVGCLLSGCLPSDPDLQPVGLQEDGSDLLLVVPLCDGEQIRMVEYENVETSVVEPLTFTAEGAGGVLRVPRSEFPERLDDLVVIVETSEVTRASSLPTETLPSTTSGQARVDGTLVPLADARDPIDC